MKLILHIYNYTHTLNLKKSPYKISIWKTIAFTVAAWFPLKESSIKFWEMAADMKFHVRLVDKMVGNMFPKKSPTEHTPTGDWVSLKLWIPKMIRYPCVIYLEWRSTVQKVRRKLWFKYMMRKQIMKRYGFLANSQMNIPYWYCHFQFVPLFFPPSFYTQRPPLSMQVVNAGRTGDVVLPGRLSCTCC